MSSIKMNRKVLGINGLGRIGKLSLWYHLLQGHFDEYVVNTGRDVGKRLEDMIGVIETDSTYGSLSRFLHGYGKKCDIRIADREENTITVDGVPVKFLLTDRNPKEIGWKKEGVRVVVDCTGRLWRGRCHTGSGAVADLVCVPKSVALV